MNFLRLRPIPPLLTRSYTTPPFIPPRSLDTLPPHPPPSSSSSSHLPRPTSPTFYTARSDFYDALHTLTTALHASSRALRAVHLLPFPPAAKPSLPPPRLAWSPPAALARTLGTSLPTARLRRVQALLVQLNDLRRIALAGAEDAVAARIAEVLRPFTRADGDAMRGRRKPVVVDGYGRTYALGKRKESAARVWMIPVRSSTKEADADAETWGETAAKAAPHSNQQQQQQQHSQEETDHHTQNEATSPPPPLTLLIQTPKPPPPIDATTYTTTILVNNLPLATYFPNPTDRQRVVRPLKLAGVLGAFNVFALVRGGGTTGQAGALAHGIAKNVVAHAPDVELILRRAKLLKRDPRMVERKKTGLAKARKRYTWVKR